MPGRRRFALRHRLPVWAFALLLAFKAAVPMLASVAATAQGRGVAEICSVYGVALPSTLPLAEADAHAGHAGHDMAAMAAMADPHAGHVHHHAHGAPTGPAPGSGHAPDGGHGGDHCALTAVLALALGGVDAGVLPPAPAITGVVTRAVASSPAHGDSAALWAARLGHGPPRFS